MQRGALKLKTGLDSGHPFILAAEENLARILWEGRNLQEEKENKSKVKEAKKLASHVLKVMEKKNGWKSRETTRMAELVIEMSADGKQSLELQRKLDEHKTVGEEYNKLMFKDSKISWEDQKESSGNMRGETYMDLGHPDEKYE
jgi:hypothetical protein